MLERETGFQNLLAWETTQLSRELAISAPAISQDKYRAAVIAPPFEDVTAIGWELREGFLFLQKSRDLE